MIALKVQPEANVTDLANLLDDLSMRLMVQGAASVTPADFDELSDLGEACGFDALAVAGRRLGGEARAAARGAEWLASALEELRQLLQGGEGFGRPVAVSGPAAVEAAPMEIADDGLVREFLTEANEHLTAVEGDLLLLERDRNSSEILNGIFRGFHTIKGLAGFLDFARIQAVAHEVETVLDMARGGNLEISSQVVDVVLESMDWLRRELSQIEIRLSGGSPMPSASTEPLLQRIRAFHPGSGAAKVVPITAAVAVLGPEVVAARAVVEAVVETPIANVAQVETTVRQVESAKTVDASVRIDTAKLDQLMDMVGEMVIAQTQVGLSPALKSVTDAKLLSNITQLARITADVQKIATGMRMVPIGAQFQKTARMVRDLSRRANKKIELETSGEETELDKTIAEELSDPLLHMVRNSIDHGIESTEERCASGKDAVARIRISAYHQSGQIVVEIADDGRGLNRERILAKAMASGLVQPGAQLSDQEVYQLIFEAGFSTAEKVTDISGRGVGMDVVRRHVERLRGRIEIQSTPGQGTTFFLKLPLTLAIIEGLVVIAGEQRYIVPLFSVREMFRPTSEMLSTVHQKKEMAMVRGALLPILRLHRQFGLHPEPASLTDGVLIVAESQTKSFCLFVDQLLGKQEVVIKSLGPRFKDVEGIAGCAILGDGRVGLILDLDNIFKGGVQ